MKQAFIQGLAIGVGTVVGSMLAGAISGFVAKATAK